MDNLNLPDESPLQQYMPPSPSRNYSLIILVTSITIVFLLIISVTLIKLTKNQNSASNLTMSPTLSPVSPTPDSLSGWKEYSDTNCGLSLRYPNNWRLLSKDSFPTPTTSVFSGSNNNSNNLFDNNFIALGTPEKISTLSAIPVNSEGIPLDIGITCASLSDFESVLNRMGNVFQSSSINGYDVREFITNSFQKVYLIRTQTNGYIFILEDDSKKDIFDKILTSVKFNSPPIPTIDLQATGAWTPISLNSCGIRLKYPKDWIIQSREGSDTWVGEVWDGCKIYMRNPLADYNSFLISEIAPGKTLEDYENSLKKVPIESESAQRVINIDFNGKTYPASVEDVPGIHTYSFYFENKGKVLNLMAFYDDSSGNKDIFDKILQSIELF